MRGWCFRSSWTADPPALAPQRKLRHTACGGRFATHRKEDSSMSEYTDDIAKYVTPVNPAAVDAIVKYCGIALRNTDSSLVSGSDPKELATVREGFAAKKLGLAAEAADAGIAKVLERMKGAPRKSRVTFYYLLAEATGTLGKLA
jgi:hypothetical protein